ncbi:MAG: hypothetical protein JRH20_29545, partial [Deltaproteobacteria bacterium]|nr:hypothetical protein [Deltaproteobacteria bacterium]
TVEAQRDLLASARTLEQQIELLADDFSPQQLPLEEQAQGERAAGHLTRAKTGAAFVVSHASPDAPGIARVQAVVDALLWAELALNVQPPARALSQLAYHRGTASLLLFGGDGMDRAYADTWSYDCATRRWSQRYPPLSPSPRAGHALLTLPKSDKLILVGGYALSHGHSFLYQDTYQNLSGEVWSYDPALNRWTKLAVGDDPLPSIDSDEVASPWTAAVNEEDVLVWLPPGEGRSTWALAVDPQETDIVGTSEQGVLPETMAFRGDEDRPKPGWRSYDPAFYDRQTIPAAHVFDELARRITPNRWVAVQPPPQGVDNLTWGTSTFDAQRRQMLFWGGGRGNYKGTNVMHYSLATGSWSLSDRPDFELEWTDGHRCAAALSFNNRPIPALQPGQAYAYDPSGQMLAVSTGVWRYDMRRREWRFPPLVPPFSTDVLHIALETTPQGVVVWAGTKGKGGLFRYNAQTSSFEELPITGPELAIPFCDGSGMAYDSQRNVLWLAPGNTLYRYSLLSGRLEEISTTPPAILGGRYALWREQVYLPGADLLLLMRRFGPDSAKVNVVYDPTANKWFSIALPFDDGQEHEWDWTSALMFDSASGLVLLHSPSAFWVLKLDRSMAALVELP